MPEGNVLHHIAHRFNDTFAGSPVEVTSPQGRFADAAALVNATTLESAEAIGKHLLIDFAGAHTIWVHLGLIGQFKFLQAPVTKPDTLRLRIADDDWAAELRGPQWCRLITPDERAEVLAKSGPDPIREDANPEYAWTKMQRSKKPIADLLMDQGVFAGVGNIYRAEVLFRHGIDPMTRSADIPRDVFDSMWADLRMMMRAGTATGRIDTVAPEHTPDIMGREPRQDDHGGEVYVYRRAELGCLVCGTPIIFTEHSGRKLYWCPTCQPRGSRGHVRT